jgi:predicted amidohydrolase YtcJ
MLALYNGRIATGDRANPRAQALLIEDGVFAAAGTNEDIRALAKSSARQIDLEVDLGGRCVIPGLHDSHTHLIRGGLNFNMELRWDGVRSLADAMAMLKAQVARTPAPQWVRVVGGFTEHQFAEKRLPTLEEINAAAPDTPVFILHLYDRALLNRAALRVVGYTKESQNPPGGEIVRDASGEPTGLLIAQPNALILYSTLAKGPKLAPEDQVNSTRLFMRELNRLGITSVIDAGGGFQNYPDDYRIIEKLARENELTVRIAYNLFTQNKGGELNDFRQWTELLQPLSGEDMYRHNGAGEMLVYSAADFEDFRLPRPEMPANMEPDLEAVVRLLVEKRWPFRLHATYDETISRALDVYERVNRDIPFDGLHFIIDHAETVTPRNIERIAALGGGIAVQHRMAYQGEYFAERYGAQAARQTPPVRRMLEMGVPVGAGTDATRVASYNPWVSLAWLVSGKTVGGLRIYGPENQLDRDAALSLWTAGSAWFSNDEGRKGRIMKGQFADLAVLSRDYFTVPEDDIAGLTSVLTMVGGRIVHGEDEFKSLAPPAPKASPDWSPVNLHGGYQAKAKSPYGISARTACCDPTAHAACNVHGHNHAHAFKAGPPGADKRFWGALGCACWAF